MTDSQRNILYSAKCTQNISPAQRTASKKTSENRTLPRVTATFLTPVLGSSIWLFVGVSELFFDIISDIPDAVLG